MHNSFYRRGKTYEQLYGINKARRIKNLYSKQRRGVKRTPHTKEARNKISLSLLNHKVSDIAKVKMRKARKKYFSDNKNLMKQRRTIKNLWRNLEYRNKQVASIVLGWHNSPTIPEQKVKKLLRGSHFNFNGSSKNIVIDGFVPDFININKKKIIEVYGGYHHKLPVVRKRDRRRLKSYRNKGFEVLIIWCKELKNINKLRTKIEEFVK